MIPKERIIEGGKNYGDTALIEGRSLIGIEATEHLSQSHSSAVCGLDYGDTALIKVADMRFLFLILDNPYNATILDRLPELPFETWLTSGCLVQTVWNRMAGWEATAHIGDYDLMYFDRDTSWEAEDALIRRTADWSPPPP